MSIRNFLNLTLSLLFTLSLLACPTNGNNTQTNNDDSALTKNFSLFKQKRFFHLDVGDVIQVKVYGERQLSGQFQIYPSCEISFPMVKKVKVCGKTPGDIRNEITKRLHKEYFQEEPTVSVKVVEYNSKKIYVFGEVNKPGRLDFFSGLTIITAIAYAGGFTNKAAKNQINLLRKEDDGKTKTYLIPLGSLGKSSISALFLQPGDIVYVPESWL